MLGFQRVSPNDFISFSNTQPSYIDIEQALIKIGGGDQKGLSFKLFALNLAGWKHSKYVSFSSQPNDAAKAFNIIRQALMVSNQPIHLLQVIEQQLCDDSQEISTSGCHEPRLKCAS